MLLVSVLINLKNRTSTTVFNRLNSLSGQSLLTSLNVVGNNIGSGAALEKLNNKL